MSKQKPQPALTNINAKRAIECFITGQIEMLNKNLIAIDAEIKQRQAELADYSHTRQNIVNTLEGFNTFKTTRIDKNAKP